MFLDEIGEMALPLQSKLLRFLEEKTFKRVGGTADIGVDVRIIAATNQDLEQKARDRTFREDLFYRLNVLPVKLPPLRDRADDIPVLVRFFVDGFNREFRKHVQEVAPEAIEALRRQAWPGNVRELRNAIERAVLLSDGQRLAEGDFPMLRPKAGLSTGLTLPPAGTDLEAIERDLVVQALERAGWNQTRAATLLGLNRDQIRYRIKKFALARQIASDQRGTAVAS